MDMVGGLLAEDTVIVPHELVEEAPFESVAVMLTV